MDAPHREDARQRPSGPDLLNHQDMDQGDMDHGSMDHGSMDHGSMDMDMSPGGIALAEGGPDRDGLEMDVLHMPLGPVLSHWPGGLVLRCVLHGDVIGAAEAEFLTSAAEQAHEDPASGSVRSLDNVVSLLALAGWDAAAGEARHVRDDILGGGEHASERLRRLDRRVRRSVVLRWSLRRLAPIGQDDLAAHDLPAGLAGDTYDRLLAMLDRVDHGEQAPVQPFPVSALPDLVTGLDLAAARLVVASLDLQELYPGRTKAPEESHA